MNDDYKGAYLKAVADVAFLTSRIYQLEQELLAAQAQQESQLISVGEVNNKYGDPEAFAERSYYINEQVLQTVPIGSKLVAIPPAPEGGE